MLEFNNPERAKDYLEHVLRLFGTTAMDHWTDADAFDIRNAIAVIVDKDLGWSTELPDIPCTAWMCVIRRRDERVMVASTFLVDVDRSRHNGVPVRVFKEPIFRELHFIPEEEKEFWLKDPVTLYKAIEPPYTNMQALITKTKAKEEENEDQ